MSWSYSGNPENSDLDKVRFSIGDTIAGDPLLQDEEINAMISGSNNLLAASAACCDAIANLFARKCDRKLGPQYLFASQQYEHYTELRDNFYKQASSLNAPYVGGISEQARLLDAENTDLKTPIFGRNMMTNLWVGYPYNEK